jgi:formylglycine-generating enzyme required for sulfatase activity
MKTRIAIDLLCLVAFSLAGPFATAALAQTPLQEQNEQLFEKIMTVFGLTDAQMAKIRGIFAHSGYMGQGNPAITVHPVTSAQCLAKVDQRLIGYENPSFEKICGSKYMAPLYDSATQKPKDAKVCIDQFEFPNIPCAYPVVWVRAREAAELCKAEGKRICDAHEWEGACEGSVKSPDYDFELGRGVDPNVAINRMRLAHNRKYAQNQTWSYGPAYVGGVCAAASSKSPNCNGGNWAQCGSNTYPAGNFPKCHSSLGVYDLNGNAAEHMNLPLRPDEMSSQGSKVLGYTEMKGSWFIFDKYRAHPDWCRWRAPYWHGSRLMDLGSHANYHLGFRCCKTLDAN